MISQANSPLRLISRQQKHSSVFDPMRLLGASPHDEIILLESADVVTKLGEKSMLFLDFALKCEAKNNCVTVTALIDEAKPLLQQLRNQFSKCLLKDLENELVVSFAPLYKYQDILEKMRAPSALDVLRAIKKLISLRKDKQKKHAMLTGIFSYDFLDHFEKLPKAHSDVLGFPDYLFYFPLSCIIIDHKRKLSRLVSHAISETAHDEAADRRAENRLEQLVHLIDACNETKTESSELLPKIPNGLHTDIDDQNFCELVEKCKEHIRQGDVYQIVPSRTFMLPIAGCEKSYQTLRASNPSPYMFFVKTKDWTLFGASPETFIKVTKSGSRVSIRPIAGTRRRGFSADHTIDKELDAREEASLCLDEKELAEHMMLVDLARNDIASVAKPKTRRVKRLMRVDKFSYVMHLVSEVTGTLQEDYDCLSAYQASMNMGTLMGAPKVKAASLLRALENNKRGFYGGAVGYMDFRGNMDTAIIIRSALVKNNVAHIRAGCGVVYDSHPHLEAEETRNKAEAVIRAIQRASAL